MDTRAKQPAARVCVLHRQRRICPHPHCAIMLPVHGRATFNGESQAMNNLKVVIGGLAVMVLFIVGLGVAWVQNTTYTRTLSGTVSDEQSKQPVGGATVRIQRA